eukprot:scaffold92729_cov66-Phaeocystis_antarctica.AAC.5
MVGMFINISVLHCNHKFESLAVSPPTERLPYHGAASRAPCRRPRRLPYICLVSFVVHRFTLFQYPS